jgi:hypothetical protein
MSSNTLSVSRHNQNALCVGKGHLATHKVISER